VPSNLPFVGGSRFEILGENMEVDNIEIPKDNEGENLQVIDGEQAKESNEVFLSEDNITKYMILETPNSMLFPNVNDAKGSSPCDMCVPLTPKKSCQYVKSRNPSPCPNKSKAPHTNPTTSQKETEPQNLSTNSTPSSSKSPGSNPINTHTQTHPLRTCLANR